MQVHTVRKGKNYVLCIEAEIINMRVLAIIRVIALVLLKWYLHVNGDFLAGHSHYLYVGDKYSLLRITSIWTIIFTFCFFFFQFIF